MTRMRQEKEPVFPVRNGGAHNAKDRHYKGEETPASRPHPDRTPCKMRAPITPLITLVVLTIY